MPGSLKENAKYTRSLHPNTLMCKSMLKIVELSPIVLQFKEVKSNSYPF